MDLVRFVREQWDRVGAWVLIAVGAVVLLLGWLGISRTPYPAEQIPYLVSGGLAALLFAGLGAMLWLSADLRDEWRKLDLIEAALREHQQQHEHGGATHVDAASPSDRPRQVRLAASDEHTRSTSRPAHVGTGAKDA